MRTAVFSLISILTMGYADAQPTLTGAANTPLPGETYTYNYCPAIIPGPGGPNITWDFSALTATGNATCTFIPCSAAPNCAGYPGATIVRQRGTSYEYYKQDDTTQTYLGANNIVGAFLDPEEIVHFPASYGSSFYDSFRSVLPTSPPTYIYVGITIEGDGWGTLILPTGSFSNVLRTKRTLSSRTVKAGDPDSYTAQAYYTWYSANNREYLLRSEPTSGIYTNKGPASIKEHERPLIIQVAPNPATSHLELMCPAATDLEQITLSDMAGRIVMSRSAKQLSGAGKKLRITTAALPSGLYLLRVLFNGDQVDVQKILLR